MTPIEPVEITLDKPRKVLFNHNALIVAEREINKQRGATPQTYTSLEVLMYDAIRLVYQSKGALGALPRDILVTMLWAGLNYDPKARQFTIEQTLNLLDQSSLGISQLSIDIWNAYFKANENNFKIVASDSPEPEKKSDMILTDGSTNGALPESN